MDDATEWAKKIANPANTLAGAELSSHYQQLCKDYVKLGDVLRPFMASWPQHPGNEIVGDQGQHNDFAWFCHHFAHAINQVPFAIQLGRDGKLEQRSLEQTVQRIDKIRNEFGRLEARITSEAQAGHIGAEDREVIEGCLMQLEARTEILVGFITNYLEERNATAGLSK